MEIQWNENIELGYRTMCMDLYKRAAREGNWIGFDGVPYFSPENYILSAAKSRINARRYSDFQIYNPFNYIETQRIKLLKRQKKVDEFQDRVLKYFRNYRVENPTDIYKPALSRYRDAKASGNWFFLKPNWYTPEEWIELLIKREVFQKKFIHFQLKDPIAAIFRARKKVEDFRLKCEAYEKDIFEYYHNQAKKYGSEKI